jgi:hypothetical protein
MATGVHRQTRQQRRNEYGNCNRLPETSSAHLIAYGNGNKESAIPGSHSAWTQVRGRFFAHSLVCVFNILSKYVIYNPKAKK